MKGLGEQAVIKTDRAAPRGAPQTLQPDDTKVRVQGEPGDGSFCSVPPFWPLTHPTAFPEQLGFFVPTAILFSKASFLKPKFSCQKTHHKNPDSIGWHLCTCTVSNDSHVVIPTWVPTLFLLICELVLPFLEQLCWAQDEFLALQRLLITSRIEK